ncbi:MAG: hypothetical protein HYX72_12715 [Acidobacteria bacterium]|nr:hypothetical protein [Acidobacteriota bacterium]
MPPPLTVLGMVILATIVFLIFRRYRATSRVAEFPLYGYFGAAILIGGHLLTLCGIVPVATYFTAIAWTGYILWVDAAVFSLRGRSLLRTYRAEFAWIALLSIPLWLIFEAYNLSLRNWIYIGLPRNMAARVVGYVWAFATIWPAIFETAALLRAIDLAGSDWSRDGERACANIPRSFDTLSIIAGAAMLVTPLLMPAAIRPYLFGFVWLGFILFLEPINCRIGTESLWRDWQRGRRSRLIALLGAGAICGILWEFWNYSAMARWVYVFPMFQEYRVFAMPLPGYLGFPPFALECFAMFAVLIPILNWTLQRMGVRVGFRREALLFE